MCEHQPSIASPNSKISSVISEMLTMADLSMHVQESCCKRLSHNNSQQLQHRMQLKASLGRQWKQPQQSRKFRLSFVSSLLMFVFVFFLNSTYFATIRLRLCLMFYQLFPLFASLKTIFKCSPTYGTPCTPDAFEFAAQSVRSCTAQ